ncbi:MAG: NAD-dependent succinate-semialdehyde dehydrogenase [Casimicrobium sp.]
MYVSLNPATGLTLREFALHSDSEIEQRLTQAASAQKDWRKQKLVDRCALLSRVATVLRDRKSELATLITLEMGKPIAEAEGEIEKCAWNCDHYAKHSPQYLADERIESGTRDSRVVFDPLGLVLAVMPWNYPFWQVIRFAAPALAAGNGALLKHASNVPQCATALESVFAQAGAPLGLFANLLVAGSNVKRLIADSRVAAVTLTGSTPVGQQVAAEAGRALKKQVLELGGSDPFIVLADADVEAAARVAVKARYANTGQSCISSKRFIVEASVADRFVDAFHAHAAALVFGDPMRRDVQMGAMARLNLRADLHDQVRRTISEGGKLLLGGYVPEGGGAFYPATLIDHVAPTMAAAKEETFGPVAAILRVRDTNAAIELANATEFGLGAALWTSDLDRAASLAREIEAGAVFVNGMVASDPRLPFGGVKQSGYGRELGQWGIREFTNTKLVWTGPARASI